MDLKKLFPFELDEFQKKAIEGLYESKNVLVTAHTGSGKTIPAEFAIAYFKSLGKKVIYTSPIKSLSNQKYYDFKYKFQEFDISVGIYTGDIKFNPNADCLIMTTEILRNLLYNSNYLNLKKNIFDEEIQLDINNDVACIIFDEVHYINDPQRGKVWEECFMLIPDTIQLLMLSATIDDEQTFIDWITEIKSRETILCSTKKRVVPLTHYLFLHANDQKKIKTNEDVVLDETCNKLNVLLDENKVFNTKLFYNWKNIYRNWKKLTGNQQHTRDISITKKMAPLISHLKHKNLFPAIFFLLSRKKCGNIFYTNYETLTSPEEQTHIEKLIFKYINLLHPDVKKAIIENPEYEKNKEKWIKGYAMHHSGLIPIFKEIIELLFADGYIKLLIATETFAVGVNAPCKTVIFGSISKYNQFTNSFRMLKSHEYLQMAGRAGRRGKDKIGNVILFGNCIEPESELDFKNMFLGSSLQIKSKFELNYKFILKCCENKKLDKVKFISKSLFNKEHSKYRKGLDLDYELQKEKYENKNKNLNELIEKFENKNKLEDYINYSNKLYGTQKIKQNQYKKMINFVNKCNEENKEYEILYNKKIELNKLYDCVEDLENNIKMSKSYLENQFGKVCYYLKEIELMSFDTFETIEKIKDYNLTIKGTLASQINECNELLLANCIYHKIFEDCSCEEIIYICSIFKEFKVEEEFKIYNPKKLTFLSNRCISKLYDISELVKYLGSLENNRQIENFDGSYWNIQLDLIPILYNWLQNKNIHECFEGKNIYVGNFVKSIMEIYNIIATIQICCDSLSNEDIEYKTKLKGQCEEILTSNLLVRDVAVMDSLYIRL
jgi:superfamily II RNA helicase